MTQEPTEAEVDEPSQRRPGRLRDTALNYLCYAPQDAIKHDPRLRPLAILGKSQVRLKQHYGEAAFAWSIIFIIVFFVASGICVANVFTYLEDRQRFWSQNASTSYYQYYWIMDYAKMALGGFLGLLLLMIFSYLQWQKSKAALARITAGKLDPDYAWMQRFTYQVARTVCWLSASVFVVMMIILIVGLI